MNPAARAIEIACKTFIAAMAIVSTFLVVTQ